MFRRTTYLLAIALLLAACGESGFSPEEQLTEEDVQSLAQEVDATVMGMLDDFFGSPGPGPAGAAALAHDPVVWTYSFERSRSCHDGGTVTLAGSGTRTWDRDAKTYDVESSGTKTRDDCAFPRGDVTITLNGTGEWTHERHYLERAPTGTWITTIVGDFDWAKSTGTSGNCSYDLTVTIDTAENTRTLTGTYCGRDIDRTRTWRDG